MEKEKKRNFLDVFLDGIEKVGNKLPHPAVLFVIFSAIVILVSYIGSLLNWEVTYTEINRSTKEIMEGQTATIKSLANGEGIRHIFSSAVKNFMGFAPLGTVLVALLGVGVAEGSGLISTSLKKLVLVTPKSLITVVLVFAGIMSNIASDAGYVVLVPLGAIVFLSFNRHPLAGMAATFAGVSGGFSANLLVGTIDPLLGGLSTEAAGLLEPGYEVSVFANWYFMIASTLLITLIGWAVTEYIVEPRLGTYEPPSDIEVDTSLDISDDQKKGLWGALIGLVVFSVIIGALVLPAEGVLRNQETFEIMKGSAFVDGIVFVIALFFFAVGLGYGIGAKTIKSDKDVVQYMSKSMATMGGYLVLAFFAAQFINYFSYTNLGIILAVSGANLLEAIGLQGLPLIIGFIIVSAFINLFIGSASAKWAILAPVFVPMFMRMGISPEMTQLAYRIGDSTTNIISPLMSYFAVIIAFAYKYDKKAGMGTIISMMMPFSMLFLIGWTLLLIVWYIAGLPIGPGIPMTY